MNEELLEAGGEQAPDGGTVLATAARGPGERRRVSIWMADLCGYTRLNEVFDPEDVSALMERIEREANRIVVEHGGIINQFVGDEIVALFGVPTAHEDDPQRAAKSAVALHAVVRQLDAGLKTKLPHAVRLHTGIHTGMVLAEPRDPRHGLYSLRGDTVNVAARLRSLARPDEVLVSETTHELIAPYHLTERVDALALRGRATPVVVYRLVGSTGAASAFEAEERRGLVSFVGRVGELEALLKAFRQTTDGHGQVVTVVGQSGVGKSRLLHEFRQRIGPCASVFFMRCEPYGKVTPYQAFARPLHHALGLPNPADLSRGVLAESLRPLDLGAHLSAIAVLLGVPADPQETRLIGEHLRTAILRALVDIFVAVARRGPAVLLLEDWHWADEGSSTAAAHLATIAPSHQLLMVMSHRPVDTSAWGLPRVTPIALAPFSAEETGQLAELLLPVQDRRQWLATAIHEHTGGNAFFVEQVCRALGDARWSAPAPTERAGANKRDRLPVPETVEAVLRARIDSLDARDAHVLRLASVLGTGFPLWQLELLLDEANLGEEALAGCMRRLAGADLLNPDGESGYRFEHAITQEVAYETLTRQRRRELHARVAYGIEEQAGENLDDFCETLAYHYTVGEEHERAAHFAERAGDRAVSTFSLEEARQQYRQVIASLERLEQTPDIARRRIDAGLKWAAACMFHPAREQLDVLSVSLEDARRLGYQAGIAYTLCWQGCIEYALGDQERAAVTFGKCIGLASQLGDERLLAQLHLNLGQSYAAATDYERALAKIDEGLALKEQALGRRPPGRTVAGRSLLMSGRAYAVGYLGLIKGDLGEFQQAYRYLDEALTIVRGARSQAVEGSVLTQLSLVQLWQGDWPAARVTAAQMQGRAEQVHGPYILAMSKTVAGFADIMSADPAPALQLLQDAVTWLEASEIGLTLSWNEACLAEGLALASRFDDARIHAWRALRRAEAGDLLGAVAAYRALGLAEGGEGGTWSRARRFFDLALAASAQKGSRRDEAITRFRAAPLAARFGERAVAIEWLAAAVAQFYSMDMSWYATEARTLALSPGLA
jgi:class 3 adenylate cyclase/tetratricopeptide (TPR) repeat protein